MKISQPLYAYVGQDQPHLHDMLFRRIAEFDHAKDHSQAGGFRGNRPDFNRGQSSMDHSTNR